MNGCHAKWMINNTRYLTVLHVILCTVCDSQKVMRVIFDESRFIFLFVKCSKYADITKNETIPKESAGLL